MAETLLIRGLRVEPPSDLSRERERGRISIDADLELDPNRNEGRSIDIEGITSRLIDITSETDWRELEQVSALLVEGLLDEFIAVLAVDLTVWIQNAQLAGTDVGSIGVRRSKRRADLPRSRSLIPSKPTR